MSYPLALALFIPRVGGDSSERRLNVLPSEANTYPQTGGVSARIVWLLPGKILHRPLQPLRKIDRRSVSEFLQPIYRRK